MKTLALCILALAGTASARELDASPSLESARVATPTRDTTKDGTVDAKYDVAFPTHDAAKSRAKGSI